MREDERDENSNPEKGSTRSCEGFQGRCSLRPLRERKGSVTVFLVQMQMLKHVNGRPEGGGRDSVVAEGNGQLLVLLL